MPLNDLHHLGLSSLGYLVERNQRITTKQFAKLIRQHTTDPRAEEVAREFDKLPGLIEQSWRGIEFLEGKGNEAEITARDAQITVVTEVGQYKLVGAYPDLPQATYSTPEMAWLAAAQFAQLAKEKHRASSDLYMATLRDYLGEERCLELYRRAYHFTHVQAEDEPDEAFLCRCIEQDFDDFEQGGALFGNLAHCISVNMPIVSKNLSEKTRGKLSECEVELMYAVRDCQIAELVHKSTIEVNDLDQLERTGRVKVADILYHKCDLATRAALLNDHHFVAATAKISDMKMSKEPGVTHESANDVMLSGTITYFPDDKPILRSLDLRLGNDIEVAANGVITSEVTLSEKALAELDPYFGTFSWEISPISPNGHKEIKPRIPEPPQTTSNSSLVL